MADTVRERINGYLEDAIAAERNFEDALHSFGKMGEQEDVKKLLGKAGDKAKTQHERLTKALKERGGSPSEAKSVLAHLLAFTPLTAQVGQKPAERNTQHLIITYAAAAAEKGMYESLAAAADEAGDSEIAELARRLQSEEEDDAQQVWPLLRSSAVDAFREASSGGSKESQVIRLYLDDTIAAEKSFETQLTLFSKEGNSPEAQRAFAEHAKETHGQYEKLTGRLKDLGGSPSATRSALAHLFALAPKAATIGHDASERTTQNLIMGYSVENFEVALYEVFAAVASEAGDRETEKIALDIQKQEKETAEKVWKLIGPGARKSISVLSLERAS